MVLPLSSNSDSVLILRSPQSSSLGALRLRLTLPEASLASVPSSFSLVVTMKSRVFPSQSRG